MNKLLFVPLVVCGTNQYVNAQSVQSPNIVLILCDDMGFSDATEAKSKLPILIS